MLRENKCVWDIKGLANELSLATKSCSPHPETSTTPALKCVANRQRGQEMMIKITQENINTFLSKETGNQKQSYLSSIGKNLESALEYYPMDVQFELGSRIFELVHTFSRQCKEQHHSWKELNKWKVIYSRQGIICQNYYVLSTMVLHNFSCKLLYIITVNHILLANVDIIQIWDLQKLSHADYDFL